MNKTAPVSRLLVGFVVLLCFCKGARCYSVIQRINPRTLSLSRTCRLLSIPEEPYFQSNSDTPPRVGQENDETKTGGIISHVQADGPQFSRTIAFLLRAALIGLLTGASVVLFKQSILNVGQFFYEDLADVLPKPAFYWPLAVYPIFGSAVVSALTLLTGPSIRNGVDHIASTTCAETRRFEPGSHLLRLIASVFTLGSGCSLGPEGPSVEIGAGLSRLVSEFSLHAPPSPSPLPTHPPSLSSSFVDILHTTPTPLEARQLFLAGTAAAVAGAFHAPIAGVFFSIECGNRYLSKNTVPLIDDDQKGLPRADIAAVVLAATLADLVVDWGLRGHIESLSFQGNEYAMNSPLFELPLYLILGLVR